MYEPGGRLGDRYVLRERLGVGGMAEVWEADDDRLKRRVAVKVLRDADDTLARRLERESRVLAGLSHPAVVGVYDVGEDDGHPFVVLELVRGETLATLLERSGALAEPRVAALGETLADALAHAHDLGVVHRDVKPSNILVDEDGRPRLVDFGIARSLDTTQITATGMAIGSAAYLSPEQLQGERVGAASDVYSLGLVLAETLSGRRVFTGPPAAAALARLQADPDLPEAPPPWDRLLPHMTSRQPGDRPTAATVAALLLDAAAADVVAAEGVATAPLDIPTAPLAAVGVGADATLVEPTATAMFVDPEPLSRPGPLQPRRGRRTLWAVGAVALLLLVVAATVAAGNGGGAPPAPPVAGTGTTLLTVPTPTTVPAVAPSSTAPVAAPTTVAPSDPAADPGNGDKPPKPPKPNGNGRGH